MRYKLLISTLFVIYNLVFAVLSVFILLYLGTFINGMVIPDSFRWQNNGTLIKSLNWSDAMLLFMLIIEGASLMLLLFYINKKFLKKTGISKKPFW